MKRSYQVIAIYLTLVTGLVLSMHYGLDDIGKSHDKQRELCPLEVSLCKPADLAYAKKNLEARVVMYTELLHIVRTEGYLSDDKRLRAFIRLLSLRDSKQTQKTLLRILGFIDQQLIATNQLLSMPNQLANQQ